MQHLSLHVRFGQGQHISLDELTFRMNLFVGMLRAEREGGGEVDEAVRCVGHTHTRTYLRISRRLCQREFGFSRRELDARCWLPCTHTNLR